MIMSESQIIMALPYQLPPGFPALGLGMTDPPAWIVTELQNLEIVGGMLGDRREIGDLAPGPTGGGVVVTVCFSCFSTDMLMVNDGYVMKLLLVGV